MTQKPEHPIKSINPNRALALLGEGMACLTEVSLKEGTVPSSAWEEKLKGRELLAQQPTPKELQWLWDTLRTMPTLKGKFDLPEYNVAYYSESSKVTAFAEGHTFSISLKPLKGARLQSYENSKTIDGLATVTIIKNLEMRKGKAGRFECCDVSAVVEIPLKKCNVAPEIREDLDRQEDIVGLKRPLIETTGAITLIHVNSLNQAYTVTSRLLEPKRRSHGGRCYDHVLCHLKDGNKSLEQVRKAVESGVWEPSSPCPPPSKDKAATVSITYAE